MDCCLVIFGGNDEVLLRLIETHDFTLTGNSNCTKEKVNAIFNQEK
jgi:hypothetical protein